MRLRLSITIAGLFLSVLHLGAESNDAGMTAGAEGTLDAATGLAGNGSGRESLHATGLAHVSWSQPSHPSRPITCSAYASALWVEGRGPSERILGDSLGADNSEAFQSLRLYSWWLEAAYDDWTLRAGALLADEEFASSTPGGALINSSFGWPAFISADTLNTGPAYYAAALGVRLAWANEAGWSAKAGVYDGDTFDSATGDDHPNRHGLHYDLSSTQGAFVIAELGYASPDSASRFYVGAWHHTADFPDLGAGPVHSGNQGGYVIAERTLRGVTNEPGNIETHVRYGWSPADRNSIPWSFDTAISATGCFAARPADVIALGLAHARFSSRLPGQDYERVVELAYTARINSHFSLQPDLQWIQHLGGNSGDNACLFILRLCTSY